MSQTCLIVVQNWQRNSVSENAWERFEWELRDMMRTQDVNRFLIDTRYALGADLCNFIADRYRAAQTRIFNSRFFAPDALAAKLKEAQTVLMLWDGETDVPVMQCLRGHVHNQYTVCIHPATGNVFINNPHPETDSLSLHRAIQRQRDGEKAK